jgi:dihydroneopterin aldolase
VTQAAQRRIFLRRHEVRCSIGIHPFERVGPQRVLVDVDLFLHPHDHDPQEDITRVLDYDFVREGIRALTTNRHFNLQETLCEEIVRLCLARPEVRGVRVSTEKPDVYPDCEAVGVEVVRFKE